MTRTRWAGLVLTVAVLAAAVAWAWQRAQPAAPSYRTAKIERGNLAAAVSASGTVTPVAQVQISSQVSGQIKELFVDFNSPVKQGQLIATLDPETFDYRVRQASADVEAARASVLTAQANVQSALAQVARAQVDVAEAQRDERRKVDLLAQNFISPAELDIVKARAQSALESLNVARSQVDVARAQAQTAQAVVKQRDALLQQARVDLQRTQIRSPVDGVVIKRSIEVGQTVAASLQAPELFVIARNLSDMQVEAAIDEADISRVRDGQRVDFTIDAFPGRNFEGAVKQVRKAAVLAQNVVSYTVVVGFANPGSLMLPGMTANVRIVTDSRSDVLKLPNAALRVRIAGVEPPRAASAPPAGAQDGPRGTPAPTESASVGPMAALRQRLIEGLGLSAEQQQQVDALFAAQRPRFAELRNLPDEERAKARERLLAELRAQIAAGLTPTQKVAYEALQAQSAGRQAGSGRVFVPGADGQPQAYNVRLGISDGAMTELLPSPGTAGALKEGSEVITAVTSTAAGGAPAARKSAAPRPF